MIYDEIRGQLSNDDPWGALYLGTRAMRVLQDERAERQGLEVDPLVAAEAECVGWVEHVVAGHTPTPEEQAHWGAVASQCSGRWDGGVIRLVRAANVLVSETDPLRQELVAEHTANEVSLLFLEVESELGCELSENDLDGRSTEQIEQDARQMLLDEVAEEKEAHRTLMEDHPVWDWLAEVKGEPGGPPSTMGDALRRAHQWGLDEYSLDARLEEWTAGAEPGPVDRSEVPTTSEHLPDPPPLDLRAVERLRASSQFLDSFGQVFVRLQTPDELKADRAEGHEPRMVLTRPDRGGESNRLTVVYGASHEVTSQAGASLRGDAVHPDLVDLPGTPGVRTLLVNDGHIDPELSRTQARLDREAVLETPVVEHNRERDGLEPER